MESLFDVSGSRNGITDENPFGFDSAYHDLDQDISSGSLTLYS